MIIQQIFEKVNRILVNSIHNECYETDCLVLFKKCFNLNKAQILLKKYEEADENSCEKILKMAEERKNGRPIQYIVGECEFMGFDLFVGEGVLIPRDDTEVLVRACFDAILHKKNPVIFDLCSGSGAIAFVLEKNLKENSRNSPNVTAVELSTQAFGYLEKNLVKLNSKIKIINENIFTMYEKIENKTIDLLVCNPPYIKTDELLFLHDDVKKEPPMALDGGVDGLMFYECILNFWQKKIKDDGIIAVEIDSKNSLSTFELFKKHEFSSVELLKDINNNDRVILAKK